MKVGGVRTLRQFAVALATAAAIAWPSVPAAAQQAAQPSAPAQPTPALAPPPASTQPSTQPVATQPVAPAFVADVRQFGAKGDGKTDDTAAFQAALDDAARAGGGVAHVQAGKYLIKTHLTVPTGVTLEGTWNAPAGKAALGNVGSTLLAVEGAGNEKGAAFITLAAGATLKGVAVLYPDQQPDKITPYPFCVASAGENVAVIDCVLVNPFQGIDLGSAPSARHLVRNVQGQPLRRGIYVDKCYEAGRIENVNFGTMWSWDEKSGIQAWMAQNAEAFVIARTDGQSLRDTFCYGYKVGYHFVASPDGAPSGSFVGISADASGVACLVEASQAGGGLVISNGQFVSFAGDKPTQVVTLESSTGNVQFQNCAFFGAAHQVARLAGSGGVTFANCNFADWGNGQPAIDLSGGTLIVTGCAFAKPQPQAVLQNKAQSAVFVGNRFAGPASIANPANAQLQAGLNVEPKPAAPAVPPAAPASAPAQGGAK